MARTKGAKGKKTLAKEMGMTIEQYEKYLRGKEIGLPESDLKNRKEKIIKKENLNSFEPESDKITLPQNKTESKLKSEESFEKIKKIVDEVKNKISDKSLEELEFKEPKKSKKDKPIITCERCHKPITGLIPFKINLSYLTTLPEYYRQTESDKGKVLLCNECLKKLNTLIDKFLYDEGNGIPLKYGQKEYFE